MTPCLFLIITLVGSLPGAFACQGCVLANQVASPFLADKADFNVELVQFQWAHLMDVVLYLSYPLRLFTPVRYL